MKNHQELDKDEGPPLNEVLKAALGFDYEVEHKPSNQSSKRNEKANRKEYQKKIKRAVAQGPRVEIIDEEKYGSA